jgi:2-polyprenyl-3-methyl-5-hydroxy-6-metoxy-1,4-benzoquinol methylase
MRVITDDPTMARYDVPWWDAYWRQFPKIEEPQMAARHRAALSVLRRHGDLKRSVLDVGCGEAWFCGRLVLPAQYTGLDWCAAPLERARRRWPRARFIHADFERWSPPGGETWQWVVAFEVFEHLARPLAFVERLLALARRGVIVSTPRGDHGATTVVRERKRLRQQRLATEYHYATYEEEDILAMFPRARFVRCDSWHLVFELMKP